MKGTVMLPVPEPLNSAKKSCVQTIAGGPGRSGKQQVQSELKWVLSLLTTGRTETDSI